jgi:large subunit ribosomal protein L25
MAANTVLNATSRDARGKNDMRKLRSAGQVPAVIYGHGEPTRALALNAHELERLFARVHYENTVLTLRVEGESGEVRALVREVQRHAYRADVLHVDFLQVHAGETIQVSVPLRLVGAAPGARTGGIMQQVLNDLEIQCSVDRIPDHIDVDVSSLEIGDSVHVRDLQLPAKVSVAGDEDRTVCIMSPPTVAAVDDAEETAGGEPQLIGRTEEGEAEESA